MLKMDWALWLFCNWYSWVGATIRIGVGSLMQPDTDLYSAAMPTSREGWLVHDPPEACVFLYFFPLPQLIGSSLLFVYDNSGLASINMIDFGKTTPLPEGVTVTHNSEWVEGNHEDGYLYGLDNLIRLWREL